MEPAAAVGIEAIPTISKQVVRRSHVYQATLKLIVTYLKMLLQLVKNVGAMIQHLYVGRLEVWQWILFGTDYELTQHIFKVKLISRRPKKIHNLEANK